ncbi:MAG TPA: MFS transporter [Candidatus Dormibacteraeota bacterium]
MPDNRWWLVIATGLAVFMVALDSSIVTVALPTIGAHFRSPAAVTEWTILGYLLPMVALVLPAGRWLDQNGRRPAFLLAIAGFAASSAVAAFAPGIAWLIAARVVQGAFGALLTAVVPALVTAAVRPEFRGRAMSVVTTLGPIGAVTGPAAGGLLIAAVGWPAIFLVNVPVSIAVMAVGIRSIQPGGGLGWPDARWLTPSILLAGACAALLGALTLAPARGMIWLAAALVSVPLVVAWGRLPSSRPVVALVRAPGMAPPLVAILLSIAGLSGAVFIAPFYLEQVLHTGSAVTGLVVLAQPLAMAVASPFGGYLADRWGGHRTAAIGTLAMLAGLALMAPLGAGWHPLDLAWRLAVAGVGTGLFAGPNMTVAMALAPRHLLATTGAATGLARSLAFGLGPALATIPWTLAGSAETGVRVAVTVAAGVAALGAIASIAAWARRTHVEVAIARAA